MARCQACACSLTAAIAQEFPIKAVIVTSKLPTLIHEQLVRVSTESRMRKVFGAAADVLAEAGIAEVAASDVIESRAVTAHCDMMSGRLQPPPEGRARGYPTFPCSRCARPTAGSSLRCLTKMRDVGVVCQRPDAGCRAHAGLELSTSLKGAVLTCDPRKSRCRRSEEGDTVGRRRSTLTCFEHESGACLD